MLSESNGTDIAEGRRVALKVWDAAHDMAVRWGPDQGANKNALARLEAYDVPGTRGAASATAS